MNHYLVAFSQQQPARLLVDYLNSQGITASYLKTENEHAHTVMLAQHDDLDKARQIAEDFIANPYDSKYQQAAWQHGQQVDMAFDHGNTWSRLKARNKYAPFTTLVTITCIVIYLLAVMGWHHQVFDALRIQPLGQLAENHQWWRLIGPDFLHFTPTHIVFNLLWWWMLGGQIERRFGTSTLVLLFISSSLLSNIGQLMVSGPNFGGLSGVVYAVVGFVWWCGWLRPSWGLSLPKPVIGFLLVWLLLGYADVLWVNMANTAHTLGLVSGCAFAWLMTKIPLPDKKKAGDS